MTIIERKIDETMEFLKGQGTILTREKAFVFLSVQYLCFKERNLENSWIDILDTITDGSSDGGIDFVYFDEEEQKIIIGQNKFSENVSRQEFEHEILKLLNTLENFHNKVTGIYNKKIKQNLQNALDRLTDDTEGNIDIFFISLSNFNYSNASNLFIDEYRSKINDILIFNKSLLSDEIDKVLSDFEVVSEEKFLLDEANNFLTYTNDNLEGVIVNISSKSLIATYNKYHTKGLFNMNLRKYIKNKSVDEGITNTLNRKRGEFWFLNNGLTIACNDYDIDGSIIKIFNFSIVNGAQTTSLIGNYKGNNHEEFFIPCKIIRYSKPESSEHSRKFFNDIAEATNSQKPILAKDLKANAPEMISLKRILEKSNIILEIKRGEIYRKSGNKYRIKNDILAQIVFSFVNQKPGTARNSKNSLFQSNKHYSSIFKQQYTKDDNKRYLLVDLIRLFERYEIIEKRIKSNPSRYHFNSDQLNILKNGRFTIFALFGLLYRLVNNDISFDDLVSDRSTIYTIDFTYGAFISNYKKDDLDDKILEIIKYFTGHLEAEFQRQFESEKVTSVSNFLKTDSKYNEDILKNIISEFSREKYWNEFFGENGYSDIFSRSD